jgi:hypothetical protein
MPVGDRPELERRTGICGYFATIAPWTGADGRDVALLDIDDFGGRRVADHVWCWAERELQGLKPGTRVKFLAQTQNYQRPGYGGYSTTICHIRQLEVL